MSLFLNGRTYRCLVCAKYSPVCSEQHHPLQRLIAYDELIAKYSRKVNRDQYDAIDIYTCPYCGLDRLTVDRLYEHARDQHPRSAIPNGGHQLQLLHCPVCVCFRLENDCFTQQNSGGLSEHLLSRHCFASTHQYWEEFKLRREFCCMDEFELVRFIATFLPPRIIASEIVASQNCSNQLPPVCPICLEQIDQAACKSLQLCVHQFHGPCIDRWLEEKKCCPVCRSECYEDPSNLCH
uniref:RING-type domain-containing protein n=2 Tax=Anopheles stephensi TaxID=30069 RepID=A0A182YAG8_ANOST